MEWYETLRRTTLVQFFLGDSEYQRRDIVKTTGRVVEGSGWRSMLGRVVNCIRTAN